MDCRENSHGKDISLMDYIGMQIGIIVDECDEFKGHNIVSGDINESLLFFIDWKT